MSSDAELVLCPRPPRSSAPVPALPLDTARCLCVWVKRSSPPCSVHTVTFLHFSSPPPTHARARAHTQTHFSVVTECFYAREEFCLSLSVFVGGAKAELYMILENSMPGGQRSLADCSSWGHKESELSARARTHTHTHCFVF